MGVLKAKVGGTWVEIPGVGAPSLPTSGLDAAKPTSGPPGYQYFATDTLRLWLWDGAAWSIIYGPVPWIAVTFQNSWANKAGDQSCQYRKIGDIVYLRGVMTRTTVTYGQAAFTLPAGYFPPATLRPNPLALNTAGTQSLARCDVLNNGVYAPQVGPTPDVGWWAIDYQFSVTP